MNLNECAIHLVDTINPEHEANDPSDEISDLSFLYLLSETNPAYQFTPYSPLGMIESRAEVYHSGYKDELLSNDVSPVSAVDEISPRKVETAVLLYEWINEGEEIDQTDYPAYQEASMEEIHTVTSVFNRICGQLTYNITNLPEKSNDITDEDIRGIAKIAQFYKKRIRYGVRFELLELIAIRSVTRNIARNLYEEGIVNREDLRDCNKYKVYKSCLEDEQKATNILKNVARKDFEVSASNIKREGEMTTEIKQRDNSYTERNVENKNSDNQESKWENLRKRVYAKDDYQCQNCGSGGGPNGDTELHAHHIVPKSRGGNDKMSNLVTLCVDCHQSIHPHMKERQ